MSTTKTQKAKAYSMKATEGKREYVSISYLQRSIDRAFKAGWISGQAASEGEMNMMAEAIEYALDNGDINETWTLLREAVETKGE
jgi:hypothetical protein